MEKDDIIEEKENDGLIPSIVEDSTLAPVEVLGEFSEEVNVPSEAAIFVEIVPESLSVGNLANPDPPSIEEKKDEVLIQDFDIKDKVALISSTMEANGTLDRPSDVWNPIPLSQVLPKERHPWSPSRQSTVSSMAGNSVCDDINDDDALIMELINKGLTNLASSPMNASSNTDEKSVRSENTRPDPPSTILTTGIHDRGSIIPEIPLDDTFVHATAAFPHDPPGPTTALDFDATEADPPMAEEVVAAAQALAGLSVNTMNGDTADLNQSTSQRNGELQWDLDRMALLAETPGAVTTRKFVMETSSSLREDLTAPDPEMEDTFTQEFRRPTAHVVVPSARTITGADNLVVLPRVDEHRFYNSGDSDATSNHIAGSLQHPPPPVYGYGVRSADPIPTAQMMSGMNRGSGRRKIKLRLQEEVRNPTSSIKRHFRSSSLLGTIRKSSTRMLRFGGSLRTSSFDTDDLDSSLPAELYKTVDRGSISISWFDGTSSLELQQHVRKSVLRKVQLINDAVVDIDDQRIFDESYSPPEEIVLSPFMPDGAQFVLRFSTTTAKRGNDRVREYDGSMTPMSIYSGRAPDSPSASPSPHLEKYLLQGLNSKQLSLLNSLNVPLERSRNQKPKSTKANRATATPPVRQLSGIKNPDFSHTDELGENQTSLQESIVVGEMDKSIEKGDGQPSMEEGCEDDEADVLHSEDPIESRLREITNLLLMDRRKERNRRLDRQGEKRQVVFVVANYFVLFLAIIAISAELQARAPNWLKMMEEHLKSVQNCSENQEALFECVSRGDFAGLIASILLWLSRSVATKRIFLFGFDTPKKLWTVVYESLVTSICWGISYLFIRRGMNPDTRPRFVQKYWKDAVYGSLAGFNAAFLKHILKNLIPEQVVEDALRDRQLKILGWLPSFSFK